MSIKLHTNSKIIAAARELDLITAAESVTRDAEKPATLRLRALRVYREAVARFQHIKGQCELSVEDFNEQVQKAFEHLKAERKALLQAMRERREREQAEREALMQELAAISA